MHGQRHKKDTRVQERHDNGGRARVSRPAPLAPELERDEKRVDQDNQGAVNVQSANLDLPTLSLVAVCIAGLLGVFLIIDWMQQRNVRALSWWGSAYLMGAASFEESFLEL